MSKLTKDDLKQLILEEMDKIYEEVPLSGGEEEAKSVSQTDFQKGLRQQAMGASEEFKGITNAERAIFQNVMKTLKGYAQQKNLASGGAKILVTRLVSLLQKEIEQGPTQKLERAVTEIEKVTT